VLVLWKLGTAPKDCITKEWQDDICGGGTCGKNLMHQGRSVAPEGCDTKDRCIENTKCITPQGPAIIDQEIKKIEERITQEVADITRKTLIKIETDEELQKEIKEKAIIDGITEEEESFGFVSFVAISTGKEVAERAINELAAQKEQPVSAVSGILHNRGFNDKKIESISLEAMKITLQQRTEELWKKLKK